MAESHNVSKPIHSNSTHGGAAWSPLPVFQLAFSALAVTLNITLMVVLLRNHSIFSAFKVYLVHLFFVNTLSALLEGTNGTLQGLFDHWVAGEFWCSVDLYHRSTLGGVKLNAHVLISVNRLWAVSKPVSYRHYHTVRFAALACVSLWIVVHIITMPGYVLDYLYYRVSPMKSGHCGLNYAAQAPMYLTVQFLVFNIPILFMIASFVYLCCNGAIQKHTQGRRRTATTSGNSREATQTKTSIQQPGEPARESKTESRRAFTLLTVMTINFVASYAVVVNYFNYAITSGKTPPKQWFQAGYILAGLQPAIDPILVIMTFGDVQRALKRMLWR